MVRRSWFVVLLALTTPAFPGCTLLGNFGTEQCSLPDDCEALGAGPWRCEDSVCVPANQTSGGGCTSNLQCTTENDGNASVCNPTTKECARLVVEGPCQRSYGAVTNDMVVYGVVAPLFDNASGKSPAADVTHMAIEEINQAGGLPTPDTDPPRRTTTFAVVCDQQADEADLLPALVRLRDDVGVHAYLTEMSAADLQFYKQQVWPDEFVLATRASEEKLYEADANGLLWHAVANLSTVEPLYPIVIQEAIDSLSPAPNPVRIALISDSSSGAYAELSLHLETALGSMPDVDLRVPVLMDDTMGAAAEVADELVSFDPHIVVDAAGSSFANFVVPAIEAGEFGDDTVYVASPGSRYSESLLFIANEMVQGTPLKDRFVGIELPTNRTLYQQFVGRLPSFVPNGRAHGYNILYDAIYMMTYAVLAAGVTNLTAEKLADGLTRIDGGDPIDVGTSGDSFTEAIQRVLLDADGDAFQFRGTSDLLEWDVITGARNTQLLGTYCLGLDPTDAVIYAFGTRLYDFETEQFVDEQGATVPQSQGACLPLP